MHGPCSLPDVVEANGRAGVCVLSGPLAVLVLAQQDVESGGVGIDIGLVAFVMQPHQLIRQNAFAEVILGGHDEALVHTVAELCENIAIGLDLRGVAFFIDAETTFARESHGHGGEAVVVTRDAAGVGDEIESARWKWGMVSCTAR